MERFTEGLVFKAHRLLNHSTLGSRVIKKKKKGGTLTFVSRRGGCLHEDAVDAQDGLGRVDVGALCPDDQADVARVDLDREGWRGHLRRRCTPSSRQIV